MSAALEIQNLEKRFSAGRPAVDDVSFEMSSGEIVVLLGPSGCGKTTTLRCVAGLETPTGGSISIAGALVSAPDQGIAVPPRKRDLGMVFQSYAIWPHMNVFNNVAYPLKQRGLSRADIEAKVQEALDLVGLSDYASRPSAALSGGQMQRVALARSLTYRPKLLLLDEPLSNLDAKLRLRLRADLRRIIKQTGLTALYVTHDQSEAVVLGDRIGVMRDGKLLQLAPPHDIYNRPADLFVASFTGASNLLAGRVRAIDSEWGSIEMGDGSHLLATLGSGIAIGDSVTVAVRPENIALGGSGDVNRFNARVVSRQYQGVQTAYELEVFGGRIEVVELGTGLRFDDGAAVPVVLPPSLCWAYPQDATAVSE